MFPCISMVVSCFRKDCFSLWDRFLGDFLSLGLISWYSKWYSAFNFQNPAPLLVWIPYTPFPKDLIVLDFFDSGALNDTPCFPLIFTMSSIDFYSSYVSCSFLIIFWISESFLVLLGVIFEFKWDLNPLFLDNGRTLYLYTNISRDLRSTKLLTKLPNFHLVGMFPHPEDYSSSSIKVLSKRSELSNEPGLTKS
jgi:hypothetical protein